MAEGISTEGRSLESGKSRSGRPPDLSGNRNGPQVLVVGAGPVGLAAALDLARREIPVLVMDRRHEPAPGSRAIAISRRSLELFARLGVADRILASGIVWNGGRSFYRGRQISSFSIPEHADSQHPGLVNLQQPILEQYLTDACQGHPLIEMRWATTVQDAVTRDDSVDVRVASGHGSYIINIPWLIAADGARSTIRDALKLHFRGATYPNMFVIVDIRMKSDRPAERLCWFDPPAFPQRTVLLHKQPHDIWRLDYQVSAEICIEDAVRPENVIPLVRAHLEWIGERADWQTVWISTYRAHALTLDGYRHGRVLFAGDSAHLLPIFGVRGMNSGLVDAANLAWKLAHVIKGDAHHSLLDSYGVEQREAFEQHRAAAHLSTLFMTPGTAGSILVRNAVLELSFVDDRFKTLADPRYSAPVDYHHGRLVAAPGSKEEWAGGYESGQLVPNLPVSRNEGKTYFLNDVMGRDFTLLRFPEHAALHRWNSPLADVTVEHGSELAQALKLSSTGAYLLRPDRHVFKRWHSAGPEDIETALASLRDNSGTGVPGLPTPPTTSTHGSPEARSLESCWIGLGTKIDEVTEGDTVEEFLTRLCLLLAATLHDTAIFNGLADAALKRQSD